MCNKCKFAIGVSASKRLEPAFEESSSKIGKCSCFNVRFCMILNVRRTRAHANVVDQQICDEDGKCV